MPHNLSNLATRTAAKKKLLHALTTSMMIMDILPVWDAAYGAFKTEVRKATLSWISDDDIDQIIYSTYLELPGRTKALDGLLTLTLSASSLDTLADQILDQLTSPKDYWFCFPLPQIIVPEDIRLSSSVTIVRNRVDAQRGMVRAGDVTASDKGALLKVHGSGYVNGERTQSAFVDAMTKTKWALQIAMLLGYFSRTSKRHSPLVLALGGTEQQDILDAKWTCDQPRITDYCRVRLGIGLSRFLSELTFTKGEWTARQVESLQQHVGKLLTAVQDPVAQLNVKSIRRSLEWAFDAGIDEDEHMRFIKTCIGLEAAMSEQNEEIGITEQLADRCAFLLNKTATARLETRNLMRKVYQLRSKLVHGVAAGLSESERTLAQQAEKILTAVLRTELKAVMDWYVTLKL
ncbi:HEPN domain-containing protein [Collimonas humicola]|uniref:HEPN domain-containing protein n=1 Tax=Collimonas humicola TaxID=2825886 RepID=UPI001B8A8F7B|nr:HEPN domain-containing protein [Collimonas humicola]